MSHGWIGVLMVVRDRKTEHFAEGGVAALLACAAPTAVVLICIAADLPATVAVMISAPTLVGAVGLRAALKAPYERARRERRLTGRVD